MSSAEQGKDSPVCPHHRHEAVEADNSASEDTKQVNQHYRNMISNITCQTVYVCVILDVCPLERVIRILKMLYDTPSDAGNLGLFKSTAALLGRNVLPVYTTVNCLPSDFSLFFF